MALDIDLRGTPAKYFERLDKSTQRRIKEKLEQIADEPQNPRFSKALQSHDKRTARVGGYRIIFQIIDNTLRVVDIGARGDVYKSL